MTCTKKKMNNEQQAIYLNEIYLQCHLALDAYAGIQQEIDSNNAFTDSGSFEDKRRLFRHIFSFFAHVGNISKLLWPSERKPKRRVEDRCEYLRSLLGVGPDHPLKERHFRNRLEHYDEYIDEWIDKNGKWPKTSFLSELQCFPTTLLILGHDEMRIFAWPDMCFIEQTNDSPKLCFLVPIVKSLQELLDAVTQLGVEDHLYTYILDYLGSIFPQIES